MNRIIHQELQVRYAYPVVFTRRVFETGNPALAGVLAPAVACHAAPRLLAVIDAAVAEAFPGIASSVTAYLQHHAPTLLLPVPPLVVAAGEALKSDRDAVDRLVRAMSDARLDRHSFVLAVGGGALLDAVGYAASLVHRGVRLVRMPTTVLAQNDAGVGVKTAINDAGGKNFLGTFAPPFAVINDAAFLVSLPDEQWRAGVAEAFKVALIKDEGFFRWLCERPAAFAARDAGVMEEMIFRCAELHLRHIRESGDPFEMGRARPLDFGHWSAHQLERMTGYQLGHGAAVAIGIMLDSLYARRSGWLSAADTDALFLALARTGFSLWHDVMDQRLPDGRRALLVGIEAFREHLGGTLCITMPHGIGHAREITALDDGLIEDCLVELRDRALADCR